jgi:hypothetical protein
MVDKGASTLTRAKPPRSLWRFRPTIDHALAGGGFATAFCSLAFAGFMISDKHRQPYFPGGEYLAIFAKPNHGFQVAAHPAPTLVQTAAVTDSNGVDPTPTGSITGPSRADPPDGAGLPPQRYRLVSATREAAWVEGDRGFRQIKPGEVLPGLGRIAAIERHNGRWTVTTDSGSTLELKDDAASPDTKGDPRFSRQMIFGRQ